MADVRSMLRAERASRRITHPHASYTSDGKLLCNLCETLVKSEAQWKTHLHSTQHNLRSQRAQEAKATRGADAGGKKRKAENIESSSPVAERVEKKARPEEAVVDGAATTAMPNAQAQQAPDASRNEDNDNAQPQAKKVDQQTTTSASAPVPHQAQPVDEEEYAAFERDIAALEAASSDAAIRALNANATITVAPMTAEQLAAQAREEQSAQRGKRDVELEGEREDAARLLEEEFEEMEGLEERVRNLRERREALRKLSSLEVGDGDVGAEEVMVNGVVAKEDDDEDGDDEEYDDWTFGGS